MVKVIAIHLILCVNGLSVIQASTFLSPPAAIIDQNMFENAQVKAMFQDNISELLEKDGPTSPARCNMVDTC